MTDDVPLFWDGPTDPDGAGRSAGFRHAAYGFSRSAGREAAWEAHPPTAGSFEAGLAAARLVRPDGQVTCQMDWLPDGGARLRTWLDWVLPVHEEFLSAAQVAETHAVGVASQRAAALGKHLKFVPWPDWRVE